MQYSHYINRATYFLDLQYNRGTICSLTEKAPFLDRYTYIYIGFSFFVWYCVQLTRFVAILYQIKKLSPIYKIWQSDLVIFHLSKARAQYAKEQFWREFDIKGTILILCHTTIKKIREDRKKGKLKTSILPCSPFVCPPLVSTKKERES